MKITLGKVDWYNLNGYGVLIVNKEQVFVHKSNIYGGKSLEKGETVILKEIQENKVRERKEAIGVLKIKEEHLLELENENCDANLMLNLYSKILPEKKHEYIKRQVYLTKLINSPEDFSKITKYIDFLENDKVSEHESFLRLAKEYLFNIATDYYKNIIWLNCYLEFKGSTENFVSAINSASIRLKQDSPTNWCKDFTLDFNLILTNFFDLSTPKILVHLFEKLPVQSKNTFEKEICKLFEEKDSIDILSSQFLFVKLYLSDDSKKIIFSNIITNENKITGLGDINTSLSIFKTHRDVPLLIDHILNNRYFKNELIKLPPYKLLQFIQPLSSDFKDKFILALMSEFKVTQPIDLLSEQFDFMLDHLSNESKAEITSYIINNWSLIKDSSDTETLIKISQRHKNLPTLIDYIFLSSSLNTQILELSKNGRLYSISQKFLQSAFQEFKEMEIIDFDSLLVEFLAKNKSLIDAELKEYISSNWSKVVDNTSNKTIITALNSFNFDEKFKDYLYSISLDTNELYEVLINGSLNSFPTERIVNKLLNESEFRRKLSNIYSIGSRLNTILSQALLRAEESIISIGSDLEFELACELCEIVNRDDYNTYAHSIIRSLSEKCIGKYYFLLAHKFDLYQTKTLFINQLANFIGFPENNLKQLVSIFFPNSDEQYFTNLGNRNGWSSDFIFQRNNERYQQIINL